MFGRQTNLPLIHGYVAPGFEAVEAEFHRNFARRGELGAACAIYHHGRKVVDLWGGYRDQSKQHPWREDTLVLVFSATKGVAATCLALAHSRGWLDYEERVAHYWPEFAQQGKQAITVRQLLSHQAGLCAIDEPLDLETVRDHDRLSAILARQAPAWKPGAKYGYHAISLGWYEAELLRRVDAQRRSLGPFLQEEIARPLDLEFYVGLPSGVPDSRIAILKSYGRTRLLFHLRKMPVAFLRALLNASSLTARAISNPSISVGDYNRRDVRALEIPAGNGIGQVRSLAKLYGELATGGRQLGLRPETLAALQAPPVPPTASRLDEVLKVESAYSLGFLKPSPHRPFGRDSSSFGASGAGGSFAFADPRAGVGFAYAMNRMGFNLRNDPRERALHDAMYRCLEAMGA